MKKLLSLLLILISFSVIGSSCTTYSKIEGNGNSRNKNYDFEKFDAIDASSAFVIDVEVGEEQSVSIKTDDNLLKYVNVFVENNTLYLEIKNNVCISGKIYADISLEKLNNIDLSGACKINVVGVNSNRFSIDMSGACKGTLSGKTEELTIDLSGATKIDCSELIAKNVDLDVSGASKCKIYSSNSLFVDASGASKITVLGNPPILKSDISGASSIKSK
jgi:CxxC motif-containing protein